jgi:glycosyltransferase involved in cell wall biosynthesis
MDAVPPVSAPARILHLLGGADVAWTAIARVVRDLAGSMDPARFGHEALFLGGDGPLAAMLTEAGVPARAVEWGGSARDPLGALRYARAVRRAAPALIHLHTGGRAPRVLGRLAARTPVLVHLHSRVNEAVGVAPVPFSLVGADAAVADAHAIAAQAVGLRPTVVHLGVRYPPATVRARREGAPLVVGTSGRMAPVKGLRHLVEAFACLAGEGAHLRLEMAGDGPERQALERQVRAAGLADRVRLLGWMGDLAPALARWDLLAQPSLEEGFPTGVLEAMGAGVPVLASAVGGVPEMVEEGRTGWLVPPGDPDALAGRLRTLALDPHRLEAAGRAAAEAVRRRFTVERMAERMAEVYVPLLNRFSAP